MSHHLDNLGNSQGINGDRCQVSKSGSVRLLVNSVSYRKERDKDAHLSNANVNSTHRYTHAAICHLYRGSCVFIAPRILIENILENDGSKKTA
ncbi:hypothetical protein SCLCIDRAFT_504403 [Scleroderma citrinum Foug A]|uniref:Uncharacterized protein n=1 Tax=Scleroderma citrinum Foug A TaxID=1036808 RepID=A0A0C3A8S1_9AGAM|nr:hypothetical protein SCLCIDRAFT_504403 [Scleroderma citrinum Foug A]